MAPRWIDPERIVRIEARVRAEQQSVLGDVLDLYDELTGLFMPPTALATADDQLRALVMLEGNLFGHVRSGRAAVADGRAQDVTALIRTVDEIRKRVVLSIADPDFAGLVSARRTIPAAKLDRLFSQYRARQKWRLPAGYQRGARKMQRVTSAVIHGSSEVQFQVRSSEDGGGIVRAPSASLMRDRGRFGAITLLALAAGSVGRLVPALLKAGGLGDAEWGARWEPFSRKLQHISEPYAIQVGLHERGVARRIEVGAAGELLEGGRPLDAHEVAEFRALLTAESGTDL